MPPNRAQMLRTLLSDGYFPKELPPPFQTTDYAKKARKLKAAWDHHIAALSRNDRDRSPIASMPCPFDLARRGHSRRILSIVNPINQLYLSAALTDQFRKIEEFCRGAKFSLTGVAIVPGADRAVPIPPVAELAERRLKAYATKDYIVLTDLASFYHSIYTHSIPWALHGKTQAKGNRQINDAANWGNKLDFLLRQCQDGQTKGIPVGPDTSRIISEIVLSAVDRRVEVNGTTILAGYRYVDDMFYCFSSLADAEHALTNIREAVHHFELELNVSKTKCQSALSFNEDTWPHKIAAPRISTSGKAQRQSLFAYFSAMIEIASGNPSESIATYALKASTRIEVKPENWDIYEAFLIRISREHTNTLDIVTKLLCTYASFGYPISPMVGEWANNIISTHAPAHHHFEVAWALWAAISLKLRLTGRTVDILSRTDNSVCCLLALHAQRLRLCERRLDTANWFAGLNEHSLREENWLLIYEAGVKGWLPQPAQIAADPYFSIMMAEEVEFYNTRARNLPIDIRNVTARLRLRSQILRKSVLPGNIFVGRTDRIQVEKIRGDYGGDDYENDEGEDDDFKLIQRQFDRGERREFYVAPLPEVPPPPKRENTDDDDKPF